MRHIGLPLALAALAAAACTPPAAAPPTSLALPIEAPPVAVAAQGGAEEPALAPEPAEALPLPVGITPDAPSAAAAEAILDALTGDEVAAIPEPAPMQEDGGPTVPVELAPDAGPGAPEVALRLLQAPPVVARRGIGAQPPARLRELVRAHPELLAGQPVVGAGAPIYTVQALPSRVDLRSRMPAVRDQSARGTCVYFASAGALDHLYGGAPFMPIKRAAPQQMYWLYHAQVIKQLYPRELWSDNGATPMLLYKLLRKEGSSGLPVSPPQHGYVAEAESVYDGSLRPDPATANPLTMALKHLRKPLYDKISARRPVMTQGANFVAVANDGVAIRTLLAAGRSVTLGLPVHPADWAVRAPKYALGEYNTRKTIVGYHLVLLVGYEADPRAPGGGWYLFRNSWSDRWAERGYARVSYQHVKSFASALFTPERYDRPFSTTFQLNPPLPPSPRPVATPRPAPVPSPVPDERYIDISHITITGDPYWEIWRAPEPITQPEWGYGVWYEGVSNWASAGTSGRKEGTFRLDAPRLKVRDGTQYHIQMRGRDARGVMRYSNKNTHFGGMYASPTPTPVRTPTPVPTATPRPVVTPTPAPTPSTQWFDNPDFRLLIDISKGSYDIHMSYSRLGILTNLEWGYATVANFETRPAISTWSFLGSRDYFTLPGAFTVADGKKYRIQVRGRDAQGRLHYSSMMGLAGGQF